MHTNTNAVNYMVSIVMILLLSYHSNWLICLQFEGESGYG